jgi:hypothetical protein
MPLYLFRHPESGETVEVIQRMCEEHTYSDKDGVEWKRVWTVPQVGADRKIDPFSSSDFLKVTDKPGTVGDLWDRSAELSEKRADKNGGVDPVKEKFFTNYSKTRKGKPHISQWKEKTKAKREKLVV